MPLKEIEKILANIVLLSGTDATINIPGSELSSIFKDPGLQVQVQQRPGQPTQQVQITSLREQMVMVLGGGNILVEDKSAESTPKGRVAEITNGVAALLGSRGIHFRAYGFNFHLAFDAPGEALSGQAILDRFINGDRIRQRGDINDLTGGGIRLYFKSASAACDLRMEPVGNKPNNPRIFSAINYHYELVGGTDLPSADLLRSDFLGKWTMFTQLVEGLMQP